MPYFRLYDTHSNYDMLRTFACACFVHLPPHECNKLVAQFVRRSFIGYSIAQKGFIYYDGVANRFPISRNVVLFENQYYFRSMSCPLLLWLYLVTLRMTFVPSKVLSPAWYIKNDSFHLHTFPDPDPSPGSINLRQSTRTTQPLDRYGFS